MQAIELLTLEKELLSQQLGKLQAKSVSNNQQEAIHLVSSSDAYEKEHRFPGKTRHKPPVVADTKAIAIKDRLGAIPPKFGIKS